MQIPRRQPIYKYIDCLTCKCLYIVDKQSQKKEIKILQNPETREGCGPSESTQAGLEFPSPIIPGYVWARMAKQFSVSYSHTLIQSHQL